ncbi:MAG TPA: polymer-forming cytoskeletal protein [Chitinophagales bacterium]|nr:polymer-forming cytoskeletal protein [Chitinophagales bacterium]
MQKKKTVKKENKKEQKSVVANRINQDCTLNGDLMSETDIRIDGTVNGHITSEAKVVIGDTGTVRGNIKCNNLTSEGIIHGNIDVSETLYLRKASSTGPYSVRFRKIIIEDGAIVQCKLLPHTNLTQSDNEEESQ